MPPRASLLLPAAAAALLLTGCARDADLYPSLSIRDADRVTGVFDPVEPEPYVAPKPGPQTLGRLGKLRADAETAHVRFQAAAGRARAVSGRNAAVGSEAWSLAQLAFAELASAKSEIMLPLAELDILYVEAMTEQQDTSEIEAARNAVEKLAQSEDAVIASLYGS